MAYANISHISLLYFFW
ncbi:hypothetical protein CLOP_g2647, partial [Closterium sp. NIES-67]